MVVISLLRIKSQSISCCLSKCCIFLPGLSAPARLTSVVLIPIFDVFTATLAAPPALSSKISIPTTGTGASGEILFVDPCQ